MIHANNKLEIIMHKSQKRKIRRHLLGNRWFIGITMLALLAIAYALDSLSGADVLGGIAMATVGAVVLPEAEFQAKVLKGIEDTGGEVKAVKTKQDELVTNFDRLDKDTKKAFEDLDKLKKTANDTDANFRETVRSIENIQSQLRREIRMAYGDPIKRIQGDEELRLRFNAAIRMAVNKDGDMLGLIRSKFPSDFVKKALGEDSSPGSTLINQQLAQEMYDTLATYGIWNTFAVRRLGTKTNIFPVKTARAIAVAIINEGTQIPDDTNKAGTTVTATVVDVAVLLNVYMRLIEDAEFDVTGDILGDFGEAAAYRLDWFCTQADGGADTTDGGMTGIFGGGGTAAAAAAGNTSVETTDLEDWTKCLLTVDAAILERPCKWWMHPQILVRALSVKDSNGRPIFLNALEAPTKGGIGSILGYPVVPGHVCPSTNAANAKVAVFGDPNGQVVGIRNDFSVAASDHHKWDYNMRSFRGIGRAATKIRKATAFSVLTLPAA